MLYANVYLAIPENLMYQFIYRGRAPRNLLQTIVKSIQDSFTNISS